MPYFLAASVQRQMPRCLLFPFPAAVDGNAKIYAKVLSGSRNDLAPSAAVGRCLRHYEDLSSIGVPELQMVPFGHQNASPFHQFIGYQLHLAIVDGSSKTLANHFAFSLQAFGFGTIPACRKDSLAKGLDAVNQFLTFL